MLVHGLVQRGTKGSGKESRLMGGGQGQGHPLEEMGGIKWHMCTQATHAIQAEGVVVGRSPTTQGPRKGKPWKF